MGNYILDVLMVEDSENDAALLIGEIERKGYTLVHQRVQTKEDFLAALGTRPWDIIVSDYVLPQFSGPEALALLRQQELDIPFIMVSGVYGEDKAVAVMKAGADDYILKENLSRLVPAIEREIEAAQVRRMRKRSEGARQYLAAIVESSEDAIYGMNLDSIIVSWNPAAERLFGYSAEEIIGRSTAVLFPPGHRDELLSIIAAIRRGETIGIRDTERRHQNGRIIPVSLTLSPIKNNVNEVVGASAIARDMSRQKLAEKERQQLIEKLATAASQVKLLTGLLPICATCKRIRDDSGYWEQVEVYLAKNAEVAFSHGICPQCVESYERELKHLDA
jgi:PAS domain S-box-containing protein